MLPELLPTLYESTPVEWTSAYGLAESIDRLNAVTRRTAFNVVAEPTLVGRVSNERVVLQRVAPMVRNSFKPFFIGRFEKEGGRVVLRGRFTMLPIVKAFLSLWFGLLAAGAVFALATVLATRPWEPRRLAFALFPAGMIGFGIVILKLGRWLARDDRAFMVSTIQRALGPAASPAPERENSDGKSVVRVTAGMLALFGLGNVLFATLDNRALNGMDAGVLFGWMGSHRFRLAATALGWLLIILALGVYRRSRLAWLAGFPILAAGSMFSIWSIVAVPQPLALPPVIKVLFALAGVLVTVYWGRWWHAQRRHFVAE